MGIGRVLTLNMRHFTGFEIQGARAHCALSCA